MNLTPTVVMTPRRSFRIEYTLRLANSGDNWELRTRPDSLVWRRGESGGYRDKTNRSQTVGRLLFNGSGLEHRLVMPLVLNDLRPRAALI